MGKTSLVLNIAQHVGHEDRHDGRPVQPRNVEGAAVPAHAHRPRRASTRTGCAAGSSASATGAGCRRRSARSARRKIFIDDTPSIGVLEMRAKCRRLAAEHGLHLVIIDYIQLMQGRGRFENRTLELASISRSLKGLAKELQRADRRALAAQPRARSRAPIIGRSCRTCASRAPSSRTPTSSSSSTARISTPTRTRRRPTRRASPS